MNTQTYQYPFFINTNEGRFLVLKYIKVSDIRTLECDINKTASCLLKDDDKQQTSPCNKQLSPQISKCSEPKDNHIPFMKTNILENMFNTNKNNASRILG
nr:VP11 [Wadden Sea poxvirus]